MKSILKNTGWGLLGEIAIRGSKLCQMILIARILSIEDFGRINYIISFVGLMSVALDFGVFQMAVKALARDPAGVSFRLYGRVKIITVVLSVLLLTACALIIMPPRDARNTIGMAIFIGLNEISMFVGVAFRVQGEFWKETILRTIAALLQLMACALVLLVGGDLESIISSLVMISLFGLIPLTIVWRSQPQAVGKNLRWFGPSYIWYDCLPLAVSILVYSIYMNLDIVILSNFVSMEEVGQYGAVVKTIFGLMIMPLAYFQFASLPEYVAKKDGEQFFTQWFQNYLMSTTAGALFSITIACFSESFLILLFGKNFNSASSMLIAFTFIGFMFYLYAPLSQWLLIQGMQKVILHVQAVAAIISVITYFFFIPLWGLWGAVTATLLVHIIILIGYALAFFRMQTLSQFMPQIFAIIRLILGSTAAIFLLFGHFFGPLGSKILAICVFMTVTHRECINFLKYFYLLTARYKNDSFT